MISNKSYPIHFLLFGVVGSVVLLTAVTSAFAFKCVTSAEHSFVSLHWSRKSVSFGIDARGSKQTLWQDVVEATHGAFSRWESPRCSFLTLEDKGIVDDSERLDIEVVFIQDDWPHARHKLAHTSYDYDSNTGQLHHVEIALNEQNFEFVNAEVMRATGGCENENQFDLEAVLTLEVGRSLGLVPAHVASRAEDSILDATPATESCELSARNLSPQDYEALCFVYAREGPAQQCEQLPVNADSYVSNEPFGCSNMPDGRASWVEFGLLILMLYCVQFRLRRRPSLTNRRRVDTCNTQRLSPRFISPDAEDEEQRWRWRVTVS